MKQETTGFDILQRETMLRWYDELSPEYQELVFRFVRGLRIGGIQ